MTPGV
jgi:hypothetical protein